MIGRDPRVELEKLRKIFLTPDLILRSQLLTENLQESRDRASLFAERDIASLLGK